MRSLVNRFGLSLLCLSLAACTTEVRTTGHNVFTNGGFENGDLTGWTVTAYLNNQGGLSVIPPQTFANLNLRESAGSLATEVVTGAIESQPDPTLGAGASLRFPKYGSYSGRVNKTAAVTGSSYNTNSLSQTMTLSIDDVDPTDGQIHIRFVDAPVLENPSHPAAQQPYFFIQLNNLTKGTTLYTNFNYAGQPGVPWKSVGSTQYTDWQSVDVAPGTGAVLGDSIQLFVLAAGCSQSGHFGRVYVDAFGSVIPGIFVTGTAPATANHDTDLVYTLTYKNGGTGASTNTVVRFNTPTDTTFQAVSLGAGCATKPAIGGTGNVSCNIGTLAAGASASFTVTVHISASKTGLLTAGDYDISADSIAPLLGTKIDTLVSSPPASVTVVSGNPQSTKFGTAFADLLTVVVKDASNNAIPGVEVTFTAPGSAATAVLTGSPATTNGAGQASVSAVANGTIGGPYTVNATVAGVASPAAFSLTNTAGPPATISVVSGSGQTAGITTAFSDSLVVLVQDADGNPVPSGTVVTFTAPGSGASAAISGVTTTDAAGHAHATATANTVSGSYTVNATATGVAAPAAFSLTNAAGPAVSIAVVSGDAQSAEVLAAFALPLVVVVKDAHDNGVPGVVVTFTPPGSGASAVITGTTTTDAAGQVSATATANGTEGGPYEVDATVTGVGTAATFSLTNTPLTIILTTTTLSTAETSVTLDVHPVFHVTVAGTSGVPTGNVHFLLDGVEYQTVALQDGSADVAIDLGTLGAHKVTAVYDGEGLFQPSTSAAFDITARNDSGSLNGGGCAAGTTGGLGLGLMLMGLLGLMLIRRRRHGFIIFLAVLGSFVALPAALRAQTSPGTELDVFHSAPAGSDWFALDSLDLRGHLHPAGRLLLDYANNPLVVYNAAGTERTVVVSDQLWLNVGGSLTVWDRLRISLNIPLAVYQNSNPVIFNGTRIDPSGRRGIGDISLGADIRLVGTYGDPFTLAVGGKLQLPSGSQEDLLGNGRTGAEPYLAAAGRYGIFEYASHLGVAFRTGQISNVNFNHELRFGAAAGVRFFDNKLLIGPEVYGSKDLGSTTNDNRSTGVEVDGGAHYQVASDWRVGVGGGRVVKNSPGMPDLRLFASLDWVPTSRKEAVASAVPAATPSATSTVTPETTATPAPELTRTEGGQQVVFGPILFATGRATIRKRTYPVLNSLVETLNTRPDITRLSIEGHTDSNGDAAFNMMLSELRAKRVLSWLVDHGIAESRLEAHGFGQTNPIETNETKAGRKANRRVEFRIVGTSGTK